MEQQDVRAVVSAAREVTHATANLASVAASLHGKTGGGHAAIDAAMEAARAAFVLDDIYRRHNGSETSLRAALAALQAAEAAVRNARAVVEAAPPVQVVHADASRPLSTG